MPRFQTTDPGYTARSSSPEPASPPNPSPARRSTTCAAATATTTTARTARTFTCDGAPSTRTASRASPSGRPRRIFFPPKSSNYMWYAVIRWGSVPSNAPTFEVSGLPKRSKPQSAPCPLRNNQGISPPEHRYQNRRHPNQKNLSQECAQPWLKKLTSTKTI